MDFKKDAEQIKRCLLQNKPNSGLELAELRHTLSRAVDVLFKLDKLKRDLDASNQDDEEQAEKMARELVAILGLRCRS